VASQWYVPGAVTVYGSDVVVPAMGTMALVELNTRLVQAASLNSSKVTVPVTTTPNDTTAVSRSWLPTVAVAGVAVVETTGWARATATCSSGSMQRLVTGLLLMSPL
jgi:hypothetical protein